MRIVKMAERQSEHRQSLESAVVRGNISAQARAQIFGLIVALAAIGGGVYLIAIGKDAAGLTSVITAIAGLAGVFVYGRWQQRKERQQTLAVAKKGENV